METVQQVTPSELMVAIAARELKDGESVLFGVGIPTLAANLAKRLQAPTLIMVYEPGPIGSNPSRMPLSIGDPCLVTGAKSVCSMYEQFAYYIQGGRIDVGFLGGAQIDKFGNINSTVIGSYQAPQVPLPRSGGAGGTGPWLAGSSLRLAPESAAGGGGPHEDVRRLGAACREALEETGVAAALASDAEIARSAARCAARDLRWACFGALSHGEIVDPAGRKLLGLAQCRRRGGVLLEGGLLTAEPDWELLCELFGKPAEAGPALRDGTAAPDQRAFEAGAFWAELRRAGARPCPGGRRRR